MVGSKRVLEKTSAVVKLNRVIKTCSHSTNSIREVVISSIPWSGMKTSLLLAQPSPSPSPTFLPHNQSCKKGGPKHDREEGQ